MPLLVFNFSLFIFLAPPFPFFLHQFITAVCLLGTRINKVVCLDSFSLHRQKPESKHCEDITVNIQRCSLLFWAQAPPSCICFDFLFLH